MCAFLRFAFVAAEAGSIEGVHREAAPIVVIFGTNARQDERIVNAPNLVVDVNRIRLDHDGIVLRLQHGSDCGRVLVEGVLVWRSKPAHEGM